MDMNYKVHIKNIGNKDIKLTACIFLPDELYDSGIMLDQSIKVWKFSIDLPAKEKLNFMSATAMIHPKNFSEEQEILWDELKNTLYFQILIDKKMYYIRYNKTNTY